MLIIPPRKGHVFRVVVHDDANIEVVTALKKSIFYLVVGGKFYPEYGREQKEDESYLAFGHPINKELFAHSRPAKVEATS